MSSRAATPLGQSLNASSSRSRSRSGSKQDGKSQRAHAAEIDDSENINRENIRAENGNIRKATARRAVRGGKAPSGFSRSPLKARRDVAVAPTRDGAEARARQSRLEEAARRKEIQVEHADLKEEKDAHPSFGLAKRSRANLACHVVAPANAELEARPAKSAPVSPGALSTIASKAPAPQALLGLRIWVAVAVVVGIACAVAVGVVKLHKVASPSSSSKAFFHTVARGSPFSFAIEVAGLPEPKLQWRLNGVDIPGATNSRLVVHKAELSHSGTYTCSMENAAGNFVWEEGYVNVLEGAEHLDAGPALSGPVQPGGNGDSTRLRQARMCLLQRAPEPVLRSASVDGGAAVIAAGELAGYLDCFDGLRRVLNVESARPSQRQLRALDLLRSMHGSSRNRSILVNVVAALDDLALAKLDGVAADALEDLSAQVAFEAGLYCASTPMCSGDTSGKTRTHMVRLVLQALVGSESGQLL